MQRKEELLNKLFYDQCSQEELRILLELIRNDPSEAGPEIMQQLQQQLGEIPDYEENIFTKIKLRIDSRVREGEIATKPIREAQTSMSSRQLWTLRIAASILILAIGSWMIFQWGNSRQLQIQTAFGEIQHIELPDGSLVSLNGNSALQYAKDWKEGGTRQVYLRGEAFFEVEKKPATQSKFQVMTEGLTIEVLGTSFNVNHRKEETVVFLEEGSLKITGEDTKAKEILLKPGEIIHYSAKKKTFSSPQIVSGSVQSSWKTGMLEFENASLLEILHTLAEANDIRFDIKDDSLQAQKLTISIPTHNMELAMSVLARTSGTEINKVDDMFIIQSKSD
ncbi:MAG: FecR domain-containing protein [Bacteroidota bacterium]